MGLAAVESQPHVLDTVKAAEEAVALVGQHSFTVVAVFVISANPIAALHVQVPSTWL